MFVIKVNEKEMPTTRYFRAVVIKVNEKEMPSPQKPKLVISLSGHVPARQYGDSHKQVRLAPRAWGPSLWAQEGMPWVAPCTSSRAHVWLCAFFMTAPLPH